MHIEDYMELQPVGQNLESKSGAKSANLIKLKNSLPLINLFDGFFVLFFAKFPLHLIEHACKIASIKRTIIRMTGFISKLGPQSHFLFTKNRAFWKSLLYVNTIANL